jgi:beta-N-acetylhexosaminidase
MTAHILFSAIDKDNCATVSQTAIKLIREEIGFKNILMSDDVSMKALKGSFFEKSCAILKGGCDIVLHCNGKMDEMVEINSALPQLNDNFLQRFTA